MTTFETYINISKKRQKYEENIAVIEKLKSKILDEYDITPIELIKESIDEVQRQQNTILRELGVTNLKEMLEKEKNAVSKVEFKSMRKNIYSSMKNSFLKYEDNKKKRQLEELKKKELEDIKMDARDIISKTKKAIRKLENRINKQDVEETKLLVRELEESLSYDNALEIKERINKLKEKDIELASKFSDKFNMKQDEIDEDNIIEYEDEIVEVIEEVGNDDKTDVLTSDMRPNRDDDKTDVLTSDKTKKDIYKDAFIEFDGSYKIYYNENNNIHEYELDKSILKHNFEINGIYDFNIIHMLKEFDKKNDTELYNRYMQNKIPVHYDYALANKYGSNKGILKKLKSITDREKQDREFSNVSVRNTKKGSFRVAAAAIGLAAMTLIGGAFGLGKTKTRNVDVSNDYAITSVDTAGVSDAYEDDYAEITTEVTTETTTHEELVIEANEDVVPVTEEVTAKEAEEVVEEVNEVRVGDILEINNTNLYYASTDSAPRGNTSYLNSNKGRVGLISIVYKGQVLEVIDDSSVSLEEIEDKFNAKYGDDVKVFVNFDLVDDNGDNLIKYVGWTPSYEITERGKVLTK